MRHRSSQCHKGEGRGKAELRTKEAQSGFLVYFVINFLIIFHFYFIFIISFYMFLMTGCYKGEGWIWKDWELSGVRVYDEKFPKNQYEIVFRNISQNLICTIK